MPDYAVLIYFDSVSEHKLRKIQSEVSRASGNTYLFDNNIHPHITLSLFTRDEYQDLTSDLTSFADELRFIEINLTSIGIFNSTPAVVNLLPVVTKDLTQIHMSLREKLSQHITEFNSYYEQPNWVPHCAIAINIAPDELMSAVEATCRLFAPMTCRISALSLVECNPYRVVMDWTIIPA